MYGAALAPILENILSMHSAGVHVEITNLLVTGLNDSEGQVTALCRWMVENGLRDVPLHFSRFFPGTVSRMYTPPRSRPFSGRGKWLSRSESGPFISGTCDVDIFF